MVCMGNISSSLRARCLETLPFKKIAGLQINSERYMMRFFWVSGWEGYQVDLYKLLTKLLRHFIIPTLKFHSFQGSVISLLCPKIKSFDNIKMCATVKHKTLHFLFTYFKCSYIKLATVCSHVLKTTIKIFNRSSPLKPFLSLFPVDPLP